MHHGISGEFVTRVFMIPKMARGLSETDPSRPTGGHPATSTGFRSKAGAGAGATFAASETPIPAETQTTPRPARVAYGVPRAPTDHPWPRVNRLSSDSGHSEALTVSTPPRRASSR